jgi:hypothetical protein
MIFVVVIMSPPYRVLLLVTWDKSFAMLIMESPSSTRDSRLVSHTERHSLKSGECGSQTGGREAAGMDPEPDAGADKSPGDWVTHRHLARPVAPPGHGWTFTSPARVQFQYKFLANVGLHSWRNSFSWNHVTLGDGTSSNTAVLDAVEWKVPVFHSRMLQKFECQEILSDT